MNSYNENYFEIDSNENYSDIDYSKGSLLVNTLNNTPSSIYNFNPNFNSPYNNDSNPNLNFASTNNNLNKRTNIYSPSNFYNPIIDINNSSNNPISNELSATIPESNVITSNVLGSEIVPESNTLPINKPIPESNILPANKISSTVPESNILSSDKTSGTISDPNTLQLQKPISNVSNNTNDLPANKFNPNECNKNFINKLGLELKNMNKSIYHENVLNNTNNIQHDLYNLYNYITVIQDKINKIINIDHNESPKISQKVNYKHLYNYILILIILSFVYVIIE